MPRESHRPSDDRILLSQATVGDLEEEFVLDALRSGWVAPLGPHVDAFEAEIAARCGTSYALALASGTAALHLALDGLGAGPDTVVIVPTLTFAATANAVAYTGATPVFVDARSEDGNLDPVALDEALTTLTAEGADIAAVIPVDLLGRVCDYDALGEVLDRHDPGIPLLADAAEAVGSRLRGRPAGSFGRAAALSFNGNKIMTTSGGGMLVSDDRDLIERARYLSTQARQPVPWYEHTEIGYNYRLSNLLAAVGRAQLRRLDDLIARRRAIRELYATGLADLPGVRILGRESGRGDEEDNCWLTAILLDGEGDGPDVSADDVVAALNAENIEARHLWTPMHLQPVFAGGARSFLTGAAERLFDRSVTLPSGAGLSDADIERVVVALRRALGR